MTKSMPVILALVMAFSTALSQNIQSIAIGTMLPSETVKLKDVSGSETSLKEMKQENGLLVMFTCNTCPYVIKNQERTKEICAYAESKGLGVILINSNAAARSDADSYEAMKEYAQAQGYEWKYVMDDGTKLADAFGAARTPEVFVFDKDNKLVYKGAIDDNPGNASAVKNEHLKNAINAMVEGKEVAVKETRSVGCGIKRI